MTIIIVSDFKHDFLRHDSKWSEHGVRFVPSELTWLNLAILLFSTSLGDVVVRIIRYWLLQVDIRFNFEKHRLSLVNLLFFVILSSSFFTFTFKLDICVEAWRLSLTIIARSDLWVSELSQNLLLITWLVMMVIFLFFVFDVQLKLGELVQISMTDLRRTEVASDFHFPLFLILHHRYRWKIMLVVYLLTIEWTFIVFVHNHIVGVVFVANEAVLKQVLVKV